MEPATRTTIAPPMHKKHSGIVLVALLVLLIAAGVGLLATADWNGSPRPAQSKQPPAPPLVDQTPCRPHARWPRWRRHLESSNSRRRRCALPITRWTSHFPPRSAMRLIIRRRRRP